MDDCPKYDASRDVILFHIIEGKRRIECEISGERLADEAGTDDSPEKRDRMELFTDHRQLSKILRGLSTTYDNCVAAK